MLVCNVSLRPARTAIQAEVAEAGAAAAVFDATPAYGRLVDESASASDTLDAFVGQVMVEAASASEIVDAGLIYAVAIDEPAAAADSSEAIYAGGISADIAEAATATVTQDGTVAGAAPARSAMLPDVFINPGTSREAQAGGIMVNL